MSALNIHTTLAAATPASATSITITAGFTTAQTSLAVPNHLFAEIYTSAYSEIVMIYSDTNGALNVQRGMRGTLARSWPAGACVKIIEEIAGTPCDPANSTGGLQTDQFKVADLIALLGFLNLDGCLELDLTGPDAPRLSIKNTGVTPGSYGGAEVNSKGWFTEIPEQWPASALPVFDPCACGGSDCSCSDTGTTDDGAP